MPKKRNKSGSRCISSDMGVEVLHIIISHCFNQNPITFDVRLFQKWTWEEEEDEEEEGETKQRKQIKILSNTTDCSITLVE